MLHLMISHASLQLSGNHMDSCRSLKEQAAGWGDLDHAHEKISVLAILWHLYFLGLICSFKPYLSQFSCHGPAASIWNSAGRSGGRGRWTSSQCRLASSSRCLDTYMMSLKVGKMRIQPQTGWTGILLAVFLTFPEPLATEKDNFHLSSNFFQFSAFSVCNCLYFLMTLAADLCRLVNLRGFCRPAKRSFRKEAPSDWCTFGGCVKP